MLDPGRRVLDLHLNFCFLSPFFCSVSLLGTLSTSVSSTSEVLSSVTSPAASVGAEILSSSQTGNSCDEPILRQETTCSSGDIAIAHSDVSVMATVLPAPRSQQVTHHDACHNGESLPCYVLLLQIHECSYRTFLNLIIHRTCSNEPCS